MAQIEYPDGGTPADMDLYRVEYRVNLTLTVDVRTADGEQARAISADKVADMLATMRGQDGVRVVSDTFRRQSVWKQDS